MGKVDLKILCVLFFFVISVQRGFSEECGARLGAKEIPLQVRMILSSCWDE